VQATLFGSCNKTLVFKKNSSRAFTTTHKMRDVLLTTELILSKKEQNLTL